MEEGEMHFSSGAGPSSHFLLDAFISLGFKTTWRLMQVWELAKNQCKIVNGLQGASRTSQIPCDGAAINFIAIY